MTAGTGEAGMPREDEESISELSGTTSSVRKKSPKRKNKLTKDGKGGDGGINESMMAIVKLLKTTIKNKKPPAVKESTLSLSDLNSLYDKHVSHMSFFKDNDLLMDEKKKEILRNIEEVYSMITNTHSNNKRNKRDS